MLKPKKQVIVGLLVLFFLYCGFIVIHTYMDRKEEKNILVEHAKVVENALWNFDPETSVNYLRMACKFYNYEKISIIDQNDNVFLEIAGPPLMAIDKLFSFFGIVYSREIQIDIIHNKVLIGKLIALRQMKQIYTYIQALGISVLLFLSYLFFLWIILTRHDLEIRVKERTTELEAEVEERKRIGNELRHLRNYLTNIIDSMPSILIGVDVDGKVTQWNKTAEGITGLLSEEAVGQLIDKVIPRLADKMEWIHDAIKTKQKKIDLKVLHEKDKKIFFDNITVYPLIANDVLGAVIIIDDVTEKVKLEEQLSRSQKMDAIGQLAGGVAHDFNNMLSGIVNIAHLLKTKRFQLDENGIKFVNMILQTSERAADLISKLLAFARKGKFTSTAIDVNMSLPRFCGQ